MVITTNNRIPSDLGDEYTYRPHRIEDGAGCIVPILYLMNFGNHQYRITEVDAEYYTPDHGTFYLASGETVLLGLYGKCAWRNLNIKVWRGDEDVWTY